MRAQVAFDRKRGDGNDGVVDFNGDGVVDGIDVMMINAASGGGSGGAGGAPGNGVISGGPVSGTNGAGVDILQGDPPLRGSRTMS